MPGARRLTKKTIKGKEGVHPGSRKAGQLNRVHLRIAKLQHQGKGRKDLKTAKLFRPLFFLHSLSSPSPLSLASLKSLIASVFITRNEPRLQELVSERRAGRPKTTEHLELEELKRREEAEFETGFEVPDLTDARTTRLMHSWLESNTNIDHSHVNLLRHIRVFKDSDEVVVSKPGRTDNMGLGDGVEGEGEGDDWTALQSGKGDAKEGTEGGEGMEVEPQVEG